MSDTTRRRDRPKRGSVPPKPDDGYIDLVAVDRALRLADPTVRLTIREKRFAAHHGLAQGLPMTQIAVGARMSHDQIRRYLAEPMPEADDRDWVANYGGTQVAS